MLNKEKTEQMNSCEHIFIIGSYDKLNDGHRTELMEYPFCIKCGLDSIYALNNEINYKKYFPYKYEIGKLYLETKHKGILLKDVDCSRELSVTITKRIKEKIPNITDEQLIKYFKASLYNIKNKTEKVKIKRLERLGLKN